MAESSASNIFATALMYIMMNIYIFICISLFLLWFVLVKLNFLSSVIHFAETYPYLCAAGVGTVALMLFMLWRWFAVNIRGGTRVCTSRASMKGKTVIITGGNSGIGRAASIDLATRGARVIIACRNPIKAEAAVQEIRQRSGNNNVVFRKINLSSFKSVREFAERINEEEDRLDVLLNNAGLPDSAVFEGGDRKKPIPSMDGYTDSFQVNHFSHFLLTHLLLELLKKSSPSRIINVSSRYHLKAKPFNFTVGDKIKYPGLVGYSQGKLANVLFTKELAKRLAGTGIDAFAVDPGAIFTSIWEKAFSPWKLRLMTPLLWLYFTNETTGAQTSIYCAVESGLVSGALYFNCDVAKHVSPLVDDVEMAERLWDVSVEATSHQESDSDGASPHR